METLSAQCDPASFGVGRKERLDRKYRSTLKLDANKFSTSFHPDNDVMAIVNQLLVPRGDGPHAFYARLIVETYKLNVLSI